MIAPKKNNDSPRARHDLLPPLTGVMILLGAALTQCSPTPDPPDATAPAIITTCQGTSYTLTLDKHLATLQEQPNTLTLHDHTLYIVESGANAISTYDTTSGRYTPNFIDVGNDKNPYDIAITPDGNLAIIANYLAGSLSIADTSSGEILHESPQSLGLINPSGVAASSTHIYLSDVAFGRGADGFGEGTLHIFDRHSFQHLGSRATSAKNPQYLTALPERDTLLITQTGPLGFKDGRYAQLGDAGITLLSNLKDEPLDPPSTHLTLPANPSTQRDPAPGRPMITHDQGLAYFVSATSPTLLSLDLEEATWRRGPDNPIELYKTDQDALHAGAFAGDDMLLILSYNQDALYIVDTSCDQVIAGPVDLGLSSEDLEGPLAIVTDGALRAYFITSLSKRLGAITLSPNLP